MDAAQLRTSSATELGLEPDLWGIPDGGGAERERWREYREWLNGHVEAHDAGAVHGQVELASWQATLADLGDQRRVLANNIMVHQRELIEAARAHMRSETDSLAKAKGALERVKDAIDDAAMASRLTDVLLKLSKLGDMAHGGPVSKVLGAGRAQRDDIIEEGIAMLGRYGVDLELVAAGYTSLDELQRDVGHIQDTINHWASEIVQAEQRTATAQALYDIPAFR